jgi:hypothetical protein
MAYALNVDLKRELAAGPPADVSQARARLRDKAVAVAIAESLFEAAAYSYEITALTSPPGPLLHAGGEVFDAPRLIPESGELTAVGCGAVTIGARLEARVSSLFAEKRASLAMSLDELGNEMLFAVRRCMQDRMLSECNRRRLSMAGELRAGDPGLDLSAQAAVLRLARTERIGIAVHGGGLLTPIKSLSAMLGIGRNLPEASWSRCDSCRFKDKCKVALRTKTTIEPATQPLPQLLAARYRVIP